MILLGFKSELINLRRTTGDEIDEFINSKDVKYFEVSTFENQNVDESFNYIVS